MVSDCSVFFSVFVSGGVESIAIVTRFNTCRKCAEVHGEGSVQL
jgi:hypothetical protein